ncbi:hypothetical protein [Sphingomonas sp. M1-B02]|uniref:hypothetical protein n=1 Tax=Sphingomonas sp. M1-B02 TaxID=3114300 RepID=UPI0022401AE9|nr:hypothetical protein [Sphingomonas sp. S6-11]UZK67325.1 hypothetical protein OKW87_05680 [Sphingomonas sp. S6-11]
MRWSRSTSRLAIIAAMSIMASAQAFAQGARDLSLNAGRPAPTPSQLAAADAADLQEFERKAVLQRELGATQMQMTEGLPIATYELDADDPYPNWFAYHISLFKIAPPEELKRFVDMAYTRRLQRVVVQRCAVLARHGLQAVWSANEPAVLPEPFFQAYPQYRGPRIDQVTRSRKIYFSPTVDHPDIARMYRGAVTALLDLCPQIDTFMWVTTDAGSGFDWTPALYPGANGNSNYADTRLSDRVSAFMINLQLAAKAGGHEVRININQIDPRQWMIPTFSSDVLENLVRKLPRGLSVNGKEGPDGRAFDTSETRGGTAAPFYPIIGLVVPDFAPIPASNSARRGFNLGDRQSVDFNYRMFKATTALPMASRVERIRALRVFAVSEVGEANADGLIEAWTALDDVRQYLNVLNFGGLLRFGHVLNRWMTRPMVPFPLELSDAEKTDYRPFLFQAKGEEQAANLIDIQAMRMYGDWGGRFLFQRTVELAVPRAERARSLIQDIAAKQQDAAARAHWQVMEKRVQALIYLLRSADNMVQYQAQLDRVKGLGIAPEKDPVLGTQSDWARTDLVNLARREIDTAVNLEQLLASSDIPILDQAALPGDETAMRLGPNLRRALQNKVRTMNNRWRDYDRLFTTPNP